MANDSPNGTAGHVAEPLPPSVVNAGGISCPHCGKGGYKNRAGLGSHILSVHGLGGPNSPASKAKKPAKQAKPAKGMKKGKFVCPECSQVFDFATVLGVHRKLIHGLPGKSQTAVAGQKKKAELATTPQRILPDKSGKYKCPECGEKFDKAQGLGRHRLSNHGVAGSARSTLSLKKQKAIQNAALDVPPNADGTFPCEHCDRTFKSARWRTRHVAIAHPESSSETKLVASPKSKPKGVIVNGHQKPNSSTESTQHARQLESDPLPEIPRQYQQSVAYTVGQIRELCRTVSDADDIPPRSFASWCAAYFSRAALR